MNIVLRTLARRFAVLGLAVVALFVVLSSFAGPSRAEQLVASWYGIGDGFAGLTTANGETFDPYAYTAAHKTLPFDTKLEVTYQGESVVVRINDRGPYIQGRDIDLSYAAAREIGLVDVGSAPVEVEYVDSATPVGPVSGSGAAAPASGFESEPVSEPAPESATERADQEPESAPSGSTEDLAVESAGLEQYGVGETVSDDQYVDAEQYGEVDSAAINQYEPPADAEPSAEPSGGPATPAAESTPEQVESERVEQVEPEELPRPSPATIVPPVEELEEPPEELVGPGTTVERRVELSVAAAPGTATDSPETPDPAPVPAEDVLVSGETSVTQDNPEAVEPAPDATGEPQEEPEVVETSPEKPLTAQEETKDKETGEVEIEVLPDTGGWVKPPGISTAGLVAVFAGATLLLTLRGLARRLRA